MYTYKFKNLFKVLILEKKAVAVGFLMLCLCYNKSTAFLSFFRFDVLTTFANLFPVPESRTPEMNTAQHDKCILSSEKIFVTYINR